MTATPRPYFIPEDLDFESLPDAVKVAVNELVTPAYEELVLHAPSALERAAATSYVLLLLLELLEQFRLGDQVAANVKAGKSDLSPREADLRRHLRLLTAKERAGTFLLRIRQFCVSSWDPLIWPRIGLGEENGKLESHWPNSNGDHAVPDGQFQHPEPTWDGGSDLAEPQGAPAGPVFPDHLSN